MHIEMSPSSKGIQMLLLMEEIARMPEHQIYSELMALNSSIYIIHHNFLELAKFVEEITTNPRHEVLFLPENRELFHNVSMEIIRQLHNFVASAHSLREHALAIYNRRYKDAKLIPDYSEQAKIVFGEDPLAQFVIGLRVYCQHFQSPHLAVKTSYPEGETKPNRRVVILKEDLEQFDRWSSAAKEFIAKIEWGVDIVQVCNEYLDKIFKFYEWFQTQQETIHSEELKKISEKSGELLLLQIEEKLDRYLQEKPGDRILEYNLLFNIFLEKHYQRLWEKQWTGIQRAEQVIEILQERVALPDEIKEKIKSIYSLPNFELFEKEK